MSPLSKDETYVMLLTTSAYPRTVGMQSIDCRGILSWEQNEADTLHTVFNCIKTALDIWCDRYGYARLTSVEGLRYMQADPSNRLLSGSSAGYINSLYGPVVWFNKDDFYTIDAWAHEIAHYIQDINLSTFNEDYAAESVENGYTGNRFEIEATDAGLIAKELAEEGLILWSYLTRS